VHYVTSLLELRHVWQQYIQMDCVTCAIAMGKLGYPRTCWRITLSYLPNQRSSEVDEVKAKLGQKMAAYFYQGAVEAILASPPYHLRAGADMFRDISDALMGSKTIPKWGTRLFTACDLVASLQWRAIV
jgi:hypothetical protein